MIERNIRYKIQQSPDYAEVYVCSKPMTSYLNQFVETYAIIFSFSGQILRLG